MVFKERRGQYSRPRHLRRATITETVNFSPEQVPPPPPSISEYNLNYRLAG